MRVRTEMGLDSWTFVAALLILVSTLIVFLLLKIRQSLDEHSQKINDLMVKMNNMTKVNAEHSQKINDLIGQLNYLATVRLEMLRSEFYLAVDYMKRRARGDVNRKEMFERYAQAFPHLSKVFEGPDPYSQSQRSRRERIIGLIEGDMVLEVGCADGGITSLIGKSGRNAVGVEISSSYLKQALRPGEYICADGYALPFRDSTFDTVVLAEIIEHADNPRRLLQEAARVGRLKVVVTVPIGLNDPTHLWDFDSFSFKELVSESKLLEVEQEIEISHFLLYSLRILRDMRR